MRAFDRYSEMRERNCDEDKRRIYDMTSTVRRAFFRPFGP